MMTNCKILLLTDFAIWFFASAPVWTVFFLSCRYIHSIVGRPRTFNRRFNDEGDLVETAESYSKLEAVTLSEVDTTAALDIKTAVSRSEYKEMHEAKLRVHPSSRRLRLQSNAKLQTKTAIRKKELHQKNRKTIDGRKEDNELSKTQPVSSQTQDDSHMLSPLSSEIQKSTFPGDSAMVSDGADLRDIVLYSPPSDSVNVELKAPNVDATQEGEAKQVVNKKEVVQNKRKMSDRARDIKSI